MSIFQVDTGNKLTIPAKCNDTYLDIKYVVPDVKPHRGLDLDDLVADVESNVTKRHANHSSDIYDDSFLSMTTDDELLVYRSKKSVAKSKTGVPRTKETIVLVSTFLTRR